MLQNPNKHCVIGIYKSFAVIGKKNLPSVSQKQIYLFRCLTLFSQCLSDKQPENAVLQIGIFKFRKPTSKLMAGSLQKST